MKRVDKSQKWLNSIQERSDKGAMKTLLNEKVKKPKKLEATSVSKHEIINEKENNELYIVADKSSDKTSFGLRKKVQKPSKGAVRREIRL